MTIVASVSLIPFIQTCEKSIIIHYHNEKNAYDSRPIGYQLLTVNYTSIAKRCVNFFERKKYEKF